MDPYPDEPSYWLDFARNVRAAYAEAGHDWPGPYNHEAEWTQHKEFSRAAYDICAGMNQDDARAKHIAALRQELGLVSPEETPPPGPSGDRVTPPVMGYVRTQNRRWHDDRGPRSFRVCSWFPALAHYRSNKDAVRRQLDEVRRYWQGLRIFWHLGTSYWTSRGLGVTPRWADFDAVLTGFLHDCAARDIRVSLSCGDMQVICPNGSRDTAERDLYRRIATLCRGVNEQTVSWFGIVNEGWQNCANREDPAYWAELSGLVQSIYPWGAHALSDPFGAPNATSEDHEDPAGLDNCSRAPANCTLVHGTRTFPDSLRRAFNLVNEGHWLLNQDEPVGAGPDVYQRDDDPRHLFALYSLHRITGQMTTFFGGHALLTWSPSAGLEQDWGFTELPTMWALMAIPETVQDWTPRHGGRPDAVFYPTSFADRGWGPARVDNMQHEGAAWAVASGGTGAWELKCRRDGHVRVWTHHGPVFDGPVTAGSVFYRTNASVKALVLEQG